MFYLIFQMKKINKNKKNKRNKKNNKIKSFYSGINQNNL